MIAERRIREERVPSHERVQALLPEEPDQRPISGERAVERRHAAPASARFLIELDDAEETDRADRADRRMAAPRDPRAASP